MNSHVIKAVIFDIDNTLYDFLSANQKGLHAVSSYMQTHFGWTDDEFMRQFKDVQQAILNELGMNGSCRNRLLRLQRILEQNGYPLYPHAVAMYDLYWETLLNSIEPFDGAADTMQLLRQHGIRIGAGTDMTVYMQFRKLERLNLLRYIDFMVTSEEVDAEKPSPAMFQRCIEKGKCQPEECLFIGDHLEKDYYGALHSGLQALWFHPGNDEVPPEPERISSLKDLLPFAGIFL